MNEFISGRLVLDPGMAKADPGRFAALLTGDILRQTTYGHSVWEFALRNRIIEPNNVFIHPHDWVSSSSLEKRDVYVGASDLPSGLEKTLFSLYKPTQAPTYTEKVLHRFLHELWHGVGYINDQTRAKGHEELFAILYTLRNQDVGFSVVGNLRVYRDALAKATEDYVELATLGSMSPTALRNYLERLDNPQLIPDPELQHHQLVRPSWVLNKGASSASYLAGLVLQVIPTY